MASLPTDDVELGTQMKILLLHLPTGKTRQNFAGDNQVRYSLDDFCFSSPHSNWSTQIDGKPLRHMRWDKDGRQKHAWSMKANKIELITRWILMNECASEEIEMFFLFSFSRRQDSGTEFILKSINLIAIPSRCCCILYPCIVIYEHTFLVLTSDFPRCYHHNLSSVPNNVASYKEQVD